MADARRTRPAIMLALAATDLDAGLSVSQLAPELARLADLALAYTCATAPRATLRRHVEALEVALRDRTED